MLRRVGINTLGVDQTKEFSITAVGEALASIASIGLGCKQPDERWIVYNVYPGGAVPQAVPGVSSLLFEPLGIGSKINVLNDGAFDGDIFCRLIDDTTKVIFEETQFIVVGGWAYFPSTPVAFDMPMRDYALIVEVGHI